LATEGRSGWVNLEMLEEGEEKGSAIAELGRFPQQLKVTMSEHSVLDEVVLQRDDRAHHLYSHMPNHVRSSPPRRAGATSCTRVRNWGSMMTTSRAELDSRKWTMTPRLFK